MVPKWPWFLVEVAVKASGDRATLHLLMFPVFCCYCRLNVCNICRELATIFLRDNDNATIFEKLATTRQVTILMLRDIVASSRKLSRAPSSGADLTWPATALRLPEPPKKVAARQH